MKRLATFAALLFIAIGVKVALADGNVPSNTPTATPVAVTSQQAGTICTVSAAAAGSQATATINGVAGLYFYVTWLDITYSAIAAPAATLMAATTTNFPGTFTVSQPMQAAVGDNQRAFSFAIPLKTAAAGTNTVVTGNAGVTSISQNIRLCGFYAP
jgi:hypothetical protein